MFESQIVGYRETQIPTAPDQLDAGELLLQLIDIARWRGVVHHDQFQRDIARPLRNAGDALAQVVLRVPVYEDDGQVHGKLGYELIYEIMRLMVPCPRGYLVRSACGSGNEDESASARSSSA